MVITVGVRAANRCAGLFVVGPGNGGVLLGIEGCAGRVIHDQEVAEGSLSLDPAVPAWDANPPQVLLDLVAAKTHDSA